MNSVTDLYLKALHPASLICKGTNLENSVNWSDQMNSLTLQTPIYHSLNDSSFNPVLYIHNNKKNTNHPLVFPCKKYWRCSAADPPPQQQRQSKNKKLQSSYDEKGVDPVGFLPKFGISDKAFAQYLRERYSSSHTPVCIC